MQEHDIADYDELIERTCGTVELEARGSWFWDELPDYLGIDFFEEYDEVRDDSDGPQFSEWYPGGKFNIAHNTLDRHATGESEPEQSGVHLGGRTR